MQDLNFRSSLLISTRAVCKRYDVCPRTVNRWVHRAELSFPRPVVINGRNYFHLPSLETWERQRVCVGTHGGSTITKGVA